MHQDAKEMSSENIIVFFAVLYKIIDSEIIEISLRDRKKWS